MKKIIVELIQRCYALIVSDWVEKIKNINEERLSDAQIETFVDHSLTNLIEVIETSDYSKADQYLIEIYNLFSTASLSLLQVSDIFHQGRYAILHYFENDNKHSYDPIILIGFIDEIIEQIYARYCMLHQEAKMKELKLDRDRLAKKLEVNQEYLTNILHSSDSAIMVVDNNEKFIAWNKGAENIFGYTEKEVLGQGAALLLPDDQKYINELDEIKKEILEKGQYDIPETERKTKSNIIATVQLTVSKLPSSNGEYTGRSVVIKDVTHVKNLQRQVDQSEKLAVIGQLAAGVAHEIGNPLTSISSLVQILQRKSETEFFSEQLSIIRENIDRISKIVRELVDFSRPPSYEEVKVQINDILKTALGIVKYDKRVKKVIFDTDLDPNLTKISVVPDQLLQVFVNILINALDAIKGNGKISVESYADESYVYINITDDGCGIPQDVVDNVFDPFFTTKEFGKGTGLGLSVSYGIIKKFNGEISVESEIDKFSKFCIKLPTE